MLCWNRRFPKIQVLFSPLVVLFIALCGWSCAPPSRSFADEAPEAKTDLKDYEESWQIMLINDARVGYSRTGMGRKQVAGREVIVTDSETNIVMKRFGQSVKNKVLTHSEETPEGDLLSFSYEMQNPPAAPSKSRGTVEGDQLVLTNETNGKETTKKIPWDQRIKSPVYLDRMLKEKPLTPGDKREFISFDPQFGKVNTIRLVADGRQTVELLDGKKRELLAVSMSQSVAPLLTSTEFLDEQGNALLVTVTLAKIKMFTVDKAKALEKLTEQEVDVAVSSIIKIPSIENSLQTSEVVYNITIPGDDPAKLIPAGSTQKVVKSGDNSVDLTVTSVRPPQTAPAAATDPGKEFSAPNEFIQSDDPLVQKHATAAVGDETDLWLQAVRMEKWVAVNLKQKNFSTLLASAAEVAKDLSGDCTEHAVLLAAMCRAKGIPARVAVGLVYAPSLQGFGGHMWTEAYIRGQWIPLDATIGYGGIAADHIKFSDSSFADHDDASPISTFLPLVAAMGKMKIEVKSVKH